MPTAMTGFALATLMPVPVLLLVNRLGGWWALIWLARAAGDRIIGGGCGIMPEQLVAMRAALEQRPVGPRPTLEAITGALGGFSSASDGTGGDAGGGRARRSGGRRRG